MAENKRYFWERGRYRYTGTVLYNRSILAAGNQAKFMQQPGNLALLTQQEDNPPGIRKGKKSRLAGEEEKIVAESCEIGLVKLYIFGGISNSDQTLSVQCTMLKGQGRPDAPQSFSNFDKLQPKQKITCLIWKHGK